MLLRHSYPRPAARPELVEGRPPALQESPAMIFKRRSFRLRIQFPIESVKVELLGDIDKGARVLTLFRGDIQK